MFLIVLFSLRVLGKRGVKQLSVFELVVIISLGSAAGDPMFYQEVGVLAALSVFVVVVIAYKITSYFVGKSKKVEELLEGSCTCLIEEGKFSVHNFEKESLAQDEFFSELRLKSVSHLGQVKLAIIETSGSVSVFFYKDDEVKMGLPILPSLFNRKSDLILTDGLYACCFCGDVEKLTAGTSICKVCNKDEWVEAIDEKRIA
ncbi:MAG: DUF421 domain-containing protein [Flavobacterium sp.]|nr:MAG: DUF421 domain-containing protein [Flavobacterium sp.]